MSARNLYGSNHAFQYMVQNLQDRMTAVERRIRWTSAVQLTKDASPPNPTAYAIGAGSYSDLISISLDPGRWVLHAGVQADVVVSLNAQYEYSIRLDLPDLPTAVAGGSGGGLNADYEHPVLTYSTVLVSATTVTLEHQFERGTSGSCTTSNAYMIAVPG